MSFIDLIYAAFVGWCGTGWTIIRFPRWIFYKWPWRWPWPWPGPWPGPHPEPDPREVLRSNPGNLSYPNPEDPDPPINPWARGVIGAIAGPIIVYAMGAHFSNAGLLGITALALFGGSFAADAFTGVVDLFRGKPANRAEIKGQRS